MRSTTVVFLAVLAQACSSSGVPTTDGKQKGQEAAAPFAEECKPEFGTAQLLAPSLSGQTVVLEGELDYFANPIGVAGPTCIEGLRALVIWTKGIGDFSGFVYLTTSDGANIMCGCEAKQNALCIRFPPGGHVRIKGLLRYVSGADKACPQPPCYLLTPEDRCYLQGCADNRQCAGSTCDVRAHRCRGVPGGPCHPAVGCVSTAAANYCAKLTCQTVGNGSPNSVCGSLADCTCSPPCQCLDHLCTQVAPPLP